MRRPKMRRRVFYLDAATEQKLAAAARAHKVKQPTMLRALINGHRPGGDPGTTAAKADTWWDSRSPARRESVWRNHATIRDESNDENQPTIFDEGATE